MRFLGNRETINILKMLKKRNKTQYKDLSTLKIGVVIESGKYIIQDEKTKKIQDILRIIYLEMLNFKELKKPDMIDKSGEKHRKLLFSYAGRQSRIVLSIKEQKLQIAVTILTIITGIILLLRVPTEEQIGYLMTIWLILLTTIGAFWFKKK